MAIIVQRFDKGKVDFLSPRDLQEGQFQDVQNMQGSRITRLIKRLGEINRTATKSGVIPTPGTGFVQYRTEYNATPTLETTFWRLMALYDGTGGINQSGHNAVYRVSTQDDDTGTWSEILGNGIWNPAIKFSSVVTFSADGSIERTASTNFDNLNKDDLINIDTGGADINENNYRIIKKIDSDNIVVERALTAGVGVTTTFTVLPEVTYYEAAQALRISNGNFSAGDISKWYGHIKRDFWGQGIAYESNGGRFKQPSMIEAHDDWFLVDQELLAPIIISGDRTGQATGEKMPNLVDRDFSGASAWANVDLGSFNETDDLSIAAGGVADRYCTCPVASMPMSAGVKYRLEFDVANLSNEWEIQDFTGVQTFGFAIANGSDKFIEYTLDSGLNGGLRIVATATSSSADFDNFSLVVPNEIAIHVASSHPSDWPEKSDGVEWSPRDRITCSFVYEFVQESELGKATNGDIGIEMGTIITDTDARALMVEAYTGAANASWNRRITAIVLYYKFHDDPDWYEVMNLDVNKGWKESEQIFNAENTGYWVPIISSIIDTGTTNGAGNTGDDFVDTNHAIEVNQLIYIDNTATIEPNSLLASAKTITDATNIVLTVAAPVDSLGVSPANWNTAEWCSGAPSTTAVATFYIPFTGEKAFSYFTNTGRATKLKVSAVKWRASASDGTYTIIANVDTIDDNGQTRRERSRVYETAAGMHDTFLLQNSIDVGLSEGDTIVGVADLGNAWAIMKERNTIFLQKNGLRHISTFQGIGCVSVHSFVNTPFGLVVASKSGLILLPNLDEISFSIRDTYQNLTLFQPALGYSHLGRKLIFIPDTGPEGTAYFTYSFRNDEFNENTLTAKNSYSNLVTGIYDEPESAFDNSNDVRVLQFNGRGATSSSTGILKTKEYHLGTPYEKDYIRNGFLSYKSTSQTVKVEAFLDGSSTAHYSRDYPASSSMTNIQIGFNIEFKLVSFQFSSAATDFEIEEFIVPDKEINPLDRR